LQPQLLCIGRQGLFAQATNQKAIQPGKTQACCQTNYHKGKTVLSSLGRNTSSAVRELNFTLVCTIKAQINEKQFSNLNYGHAAPLSLSKDESVFHSKFKPSFL